MKRLLWSCLFALLVSGPVFAQTAQQVVAPCVTSGTNCTRVTTGNGLPVNIVSGGGTGGTSAVDEATFIWGTTPFTPTGGAYQTTATSNALTNGQAGVWQFTAQRAGFVNLRNASGTEIGTASNNLIVGQATAANLNVTEASASAILSAVQGAIPAGAANIGQLTPATIVSCSALCASQVIKGSAGTLYSFEVAADSTLSGAAWWIMIFNATSLPGDGSVTPAKCYALPSGATGFTGAFDAGGIAFGTGITIGVSTTGCFTKTASTHAMISGDYQ